MKLLSRLYSYFHSHKQDWQPHEEFVEEFSREHLPSWEDEHGIKHYSLTPHASLERGGNVAELCYSLPSDAIFIDGIQEQDIRRIKK